MSQNQSDNADNADLEPGWTGADSLEPVEGEQGLDQEAWAMQEAAAGSYGPPCPVCGCEVYTPAGYLQCECPAQTAVVVDGPVPDLTVRNVRRALEILPNAAKLLGCEPGRMEWTADYAEPQPTFGDRVRAVIDCVSGHQSSITSYAANELADAIDADRDELGSQLGSAQAALTTEQRRLLLARERVEALIEELRYTEYGFDGVRNVSKDLIEVEPFLDRLAGVFADLTQPLTYHKADPAAARFEIPGGDDGTKGLRVAVNPDGATFMWPVDPLVGQGFALSGRAARDLVMLLGAALPDDGQFSLAGGNDIPMTTDREPGTLADTITEADIDFVEGRER